MSRLFRVVRWGLIFGTSFCLLWFALSYGLYRISTGESDTFEGEVRYKFLEPGLTNREAFEGLFGNRIVRLDGHPVHFVPAAHKARLWVESRHEMYHQKYTLRAKLKAERLLFGGYGVAELIGIERLDKEPIINK